MLTPQMIDQFNKATGSAIPLNATNSAPSPSKPNLTRSQEVLKIAQDAENERAMMEKPTNQQSSNALISGVVKNTANDYAQAPSNFMKEAGRNDASTSQNPIVRVGENALGATASGIGTLFSPITNAIKGYSDFFANSKTGQGIANNPAVGKLLDVFGAGSAKLDSWASQHPEAARNLNNLLTVGLTTAGGETKAAESPIGSIEGISKAVTAAPEAAKNAAIDIGKGAVDMAKGIKEKITGTPEEIAAKQLNRSINAVSPELTKAKQVKALQEVVTGKRTVNPSTVFRDATLSESEKIQNLGTRLKDVIKSKDPFKNLISLHDELAKTESNIQEKFKSDPELQYNADKPTLAAKLDALKPKIPRGFSVMKEGKATYNNVVDFGKEMLQKAEDTPGGLRTARTAFDNQAKLEYSNSFKEGAVDMKTPAGRAIRDVRDAFNEHLYNTAPEGSEIQKLIGHEADIYRAGENISQKAVKYGKSSQFIQWMRNHPGIVKTVAGGAAIYFGSKAVNVAKASIGN